jgi:hypothetical protein
MAYKALPLVRFPVSRALAVTIPARECLVPAAVRTVPAFAVSALADRTRSRLVQLASMVKADRTATVCKALAMESVLRVSEALALLGYMP